MRANCAPAGANLKAVFFDQKTFALSAKEFFYNYF
jgi:hypothetical protein